MIGSLAALIVAAIPGCTPVASADRLWQPSTRWVIVGELHGTNEAPDAFANLACLAAASGRPVTVALEYSADDQPTIDAWLVSDGRAPARAALLTLAMWNYPMQDGRGSVAFLRLWERLRAMKQAGRITGVIAADVGHTTPADEERNRTMARMWTAIPAAADGIILALVGSLHAMRVPVPVPDRTITPAGALMPAAPRTVTVNVLDSGGQAWNCQDDGCKAHSSSPRPVVPAGITYSTAPDRAWDATYELGVATTAAKPAIPRRGGGD